MLSPRIFKMRVVSIDSGATNDPMSPMSWFCQCYLWVGPVGLYEMQEDHWSQVLACAMPWKTLFQDDPDLTMWYAAPERGVSLTQTEMSEIQISPLEKCNVVFKHIFLIDSRKTEKYRKFECCSGERRPTLHWLKKYEEAVSDSLGFSCYFCFLPQWGGVGGRGGVDRRKSGEVGQEGSW